MEKVFSGPGITHISFDLDGTLELEEFDKIVWNEEIPKLYAEKNGIPLEQAKQFVYAEYYKGGFVEMIPNWTDISYWFKRFGLDNWNKLLQDMSKHILLFDDTIEALEHASSKYKLIMISSAMQEFLHVKLAATGIEKYFTHIISTSSKYGYWKKDTAMFARTLDELGVKPEQVIHIGNDPKQDFEFPSAVGIDALLIDRSGKKQGDHVIHSLRELKKIL